MVEIDVRVIVWVESIEREGENFALYMGQIFYIKDL